MSVSDEIRRIQNAKANIKTSIENKGVTVPDDTKLDGYPALIDSIQAGGGSGEEVSSYWPGFFESKIAEKSTSYLFSNTLYKTEHEKYLIENLDVSNIRDMRYTFFEGGCHYSISDDLKKIDLTKWNVNNCEYFNEMFKLSKIHYLDISGWDFSNSTIKTLSDFFYFGIFKEINMSNCNTSTITNFQGFANNCTYMSSINMTGCDTSKVNNMNSMFAGCTSLITIIGELDLSNLTNGFYYSTYSHSVYNCKELETLYLKNIYKNCTMTNASKWSINLSSTKVKDECLIYIINELPDLINDKGLTATDKIKLYLPKTNTLTAEQVQPAIDKGWQVVNTTY